MPYKYSICHPEKPDIEYPPRVLSEKEVKDFVQNYDWNGILKKMNSLNQNEVFYSPSLDFTNTDNGFSFCLSALSNQKNLTFYVFYKRLVMKKILFGILGEKESFSTIDREFTKDAAYDLLNRFLKKDYNSIEKIMKGK